MKMVAGAVIFDMDGVLINSEPLWRRAMISGFGAFGMPATEDECRSTMGMRFAEVISLWLKKYGKDPALLPEVENAVVEQLLGLIAHEGRAMPGVREFLDFCSRDGLKTGLATSSSVNLMNAVLGRLNIGSRFHAKVSAQGLLYGKPHPEVFLRCAEMIGCSPGECVVIEDSLNGVIAAKAASMQVIAVPDDEHLRADERTVKQFTLADHRAANLTEALDIFRSEYRGPQVAGRSVSSRA